MRSQVSSFDLTRARLARALPTVAHGAPTALRSPSQTILEEIRDHAAAGRISYIPRAHNRAGAVRPRDVRHALSTARTCSLQSNGRWRVESTDLSGDELAVVVVVAEGGLVVTVS